MRQINSHWSSSIFVLLVPLSTCFSQTITQTRAGVDAPFQKEQQTGPAASIPQTDKTKQFAVRLAEATDDEQAALIAQDKELVTARLAQALFDQARSFEFRGSNEKALKSFNLARKVAEQVADQRILAASLLSIGSVTFTQGDSTRALEFMEKSLKLREELGDKLGTAWVLTRIGTVHRAQGNRQLALEYHERSLALSEPLGDKQLLAEINLMLGLDHGNNARVALGFFKKSLALSQESGNKMGAANAMVKMANALRSLGNTVEALENAEKALALAEEARHKRIISFALDALGEIHRIQGDYTQALTSFQRSLVQNEEMGNKLAYTEGLNKIGLVNYWQGDYAQALAYFRRALSRSEESGNKYMIATAMSHLGQTYLRLADYPRALENNLAAFRLREQLEEKQGMADTAGNLGELFTLQGNYPEALKYFERSLTLSEEIGTKRDAAFALKGIAFVYWKQEKYELALESASRAITFAKEIGSREYLWQALTTAGRAQRALDRLTPARQSFEEAITTVERLRSNVAGQQSRATYFSNVQEPYELYVDLLMALNSRRPLEGYDALALHANERARARSLLEVLIEAGANIRQGVSPALLSQEHSLQQQLNASAERQTRLLNEKQVDEQTVALQKEIEELTAEYQQVKTKIRQSSPRYAALTQPQPLTLREIQKDLLDADTALLEYALGEERSYLWVVTPTSLTSAELPRRLELENSVRRLVGLLSDGKGWATGATANPEYAAVASQLRETLLPPALLSQLKVKRLVIVGDGVLQYLPFGALTVPNLSKAKTKQPGSTHRPLIADYEIVSLPSASTLAVLRQETAKRIRGTKSVAIIADPVFERRDERVKTVTNGNGPVTDRQPVSTVRSPSLDHASNFRTLLLERALRFGSNTESGGAAQETLQISRLPFTRLEAEGILAAAPSGQNLKAIDFRASRETATSGDLAQYRFIHFATHGLLNSAQPELSGIVLSLVNEQGQPVDGFLRLHEIYNLNLPADLVVLSACQTGLGKEIRGEGLVGLTRGFMYAGAPRVVASLWKVDDAATAELMKRFYEAMLKDNLRPAAALRRAKIEMWQQRRWQAPFYWAAFELQGEWR